MRAAKPKLQAPEKNVERIRPFKLIQIPPYVLLALRVIRAYSPSFQFLVDEEPGETLHVY